MYISYIDEKVVTFNKVTLDELETFDDASIHDVDCEATGYNVRVEVDDDIFTHIDTMPPVLVNGKPLSPDTILSDHIPYVSNIHRFADAYYISVQFVTPKMIRLLKENGYIVHQVYYTAIEGVAEYLTVYVTIETDLSYFAVLTDIIRRILG